MLREFKEFATRGNVLDLAVGLIIGAAFGKIVTSFVNDLLMPLIGLLAGRVNFENLFVALDGSAFKTLAEAKAAGVATVSYGVFINSVLDFILVAFAVFLLVRWANRMRRRPQPKAPNVKPCPYCCSAIAIEAVRCPQCTSHLEADLSQT
jgi:large conductance mechanosensitive channel